MGSKREKFALAKSQYEDRKWGKMRGLGKITVFEKMVISVMYKAATSTWVEDTLVRKRGWQVELTRGGVCATDRWEIQVAGIDVLEFEK